MDVAVETLLSLLRIRMARGELTPRQFAAAVAELRRTGCGYVPIGRRFCRHR